ncbi:hypothetical protein CEXT_797111 [Caerostris extrusa]|uniref:Uncharacterized protein n=1 Tax=Caerostris extrusa TaxID=172846 RepID=A0AAV4P8M4_CAEEX|nr:hypothetical protein CEXT_797111 [Caerostris extrusa]
MREKRHQIVPLTFAHISFHNLLTSQGGENGGWGVRGHVTVIIKWSRDTIPGGRGVADGLMESFSTTPGSSVTWQLSCDSDSVT